MALLSFIQNILTKREGIKQYQTNIVEYLKDGKLSQTEKDDLNKIKLEYGITDKDLQNIHKIQASAVFNNISSDQRITEDEKESLSLILDHFGLSVKDFDFNQKNFNKYYAMALIDKGMLPTVDPENFKVPVIMKSGEIIHFGSEANLVKVKKVMEKMFYGGLSGSIKIMKGMRYRWGTIKPTIAHKEVSAIEDSGVLYITNQRIGFIGSRKQFSVLYNKISGFELRADGLYIFKDGKELPYIVTLQDYEVPLSIISSLLNDN